MREISILDKEAIPSALEVLHSKTGVLMLQMPAVYVLLAPATALGVAKLNSTKMRLPQKNYGTAIGDLARFHALAAPGSLPQELSTAESLRCLTGAFIRFAVQQHNFHSPTIRNGTHQGLLVDGPHRMLFKAIEESFASQAEPALFGGHSYTAPLCTSANLSGDPLGSITDWERAYQFAKERLMPFVIRCEAQEGEAGSYPIFHFSQNKASIERHGPGEDAIARQLPKRLFSKHIWEEDMLLAA